jgi:hypothetical protein
MRKRAAQLAQCPTRPVSFAAQVIRRSRKLGGDVMARSRRSVILLAALIALATGSAKARVDDRSSPQGFLGIDSLSVAASEDPPTSSRSERQRGTNGGQQTVIKL